MEMVRWAMAEPVSSHTERTVLMVIAVLLDGAASGRLTQAAIAEAAALSVRAVRAALARLISGGSVEVQQHGRGAPLVTMVVQGGTTRRAADTAGRQIPPGGGIQGGTSCRAGQGGEGAPTVSPKKIPPYPPPPPVETAGDEDDDGRASPLDHFAPRRAAEPPAAELTPERWRAIEDGLAGRTLDIKGRCMGQGLTSMETARVRGFIDKHGLDTVERAIASMPDRVSKPTAYLAKCLERVEAGRLDAARGRAALEAEPAPRAPKPQESTPESIARSEANFAEMRALFAKPVAS